MSNIRFPVSLLRILLSTTCTVSLSILTGLGRGRLSLCVRLRRNQSSNAVQVTGWTSASHQALVPSLALVLRQQPGLGH